MAKYKYKDLNLKHLREVCDIDFAHYTYKRGMCSCCYGPKDLPSRYWRNNEVLEDTDYDDISYILFKNADNGRGCVKRDDYIGEDCIEWNLTDEQLTKVIAELERQIGDEFIVVRPMTKHRCIVLQYRGED